MLGIIFIICSIPILLLALYPGIAYVRYIFFKVPILRSESFLQPVSIIIAAYKEDLFIKEKLISFLHPDEWIDGSEIIIIASGVTECTLEILREFDLPGKITTLVFAEQISKIRAVNMATDIARCDILVFSDCRQNMKKNSVKNLIHNFADLSVGTVTSNLKDSEIPENESFFRRLLTLISKWDSQSGSTLNVYGALYAQRKKLFKKIPENIIFDDLFVVVSTLSQNQRLIQEEDAVIYDINFNTYYKSERIRRLARGLLLFLTTERTMFTKLKLLDLCRLLVLKYLKLSLPFLLLIQSGCILYYTFKTGNLVFVSTFLLLLIPLLGINKSRKFLIHLFLINYHMMVMVIEFVFFNERSPKWEKLVI